MKNDRIFFQFLWAILLVGSFRGPVRAQTTPDSITPPREGLRLLARYTGNSVLLRWAPASPELWLHGNQYGYWIERASMRQGYIDPAAYMPLTAQPIRVGTQEEFKKLYADGKQPYVAVAAQTVFGKSAAPATNLTDQIADLKSRWGFALLAADFSQPAAQSLGLWLEDKNIEKDQVYAYRIRFATPDSLPGPSDQDYFFVKTDFVTPVLPPRLLAPGENEGSVTLFWERAWHQERFTAYFIERSDDDGKTYRRLNRTPYTLPISESYSSFGREEFAYKDSTGRNYVPAWYRLVGIDAFGTVSAPSAAVRAMARDRTPPAPPENVRSEYLGQGKMKVSWEKGAAEPDFAGFHVVRSSEVDSRYQPLTKAILPKNTRSFIDDKADTDGNNFYMVVAVDTAGNGSVSLYSYGHVTDTLPPQPPRGLAGSIDTSGVVRLHWNLGTERDLKGYVVHYANASFHELACLTPQVLLDTIFQDTIPLNTLTEKIYYRVVAVDMRGNHSAFSQLLELSKPDTIPPVPPLFSDYRIDRNRIHISWAASSSEDVVKHRLLRRETGTVNWKEVFGTASKDLFISFSDSSATPGRSYEYRVVAEDDAGLLSRPSALLSLKMPDFRLKPAVQNLSAQVNDQKKVLIRWKYPYSGAYRLVLYKASEGGQFATCSAFQAGHAPEFLDADVKNGRQYEYTFKVFYEDGKESAFSPICTVKVD
ncbi:MAG TPA: hypothetical protein PLO67_10720 [Saprospiraceae bacterium]|nr:hypothetical protein [Saprospiraceae bacterium]HPI07096.1 hypothetical protein [Saprospiraceae bacterium]